jgi:hypothetical protein
MVTVTYETVAWYSSGTQAPRSHLQFLRGNPATSSRQLMAEAGYKRQILSRAGRCREDKLSRLIDARWARLLMA